MSKNNTVKSMIELAIELQDGQKEITFNELFEKVSKELELTDDEKQSVIAQFYTDMTACGDFVYCGENSWDLKKNRARNVMDEEFEGEHISDGLDDEEALEERKPRKRGKRSSKTQVQDENGDIQEMYVDDSDDDESEDQSYENVGDDYESEESDEYEDAYEKDFDSSLDDDDDDYSDDDDEEDEYNEIMDNYEDLYEN